MAVIMNHVLEIDYVTIKGRRGTRQAVGSGTTADEAYESAKAKITARKPVEKFLGYRTLGGPVAVPTKSRRSVVKKG